MINIINISERRKISPVAHSSTYRYGTVRTQQPRNTHARTTEVVGTGRLEVAWKRWDTFRWGKISKKGTAQFDEREQDEGEKGDKGEYDVQQMRLDSTRLRIGPSECFVPVLDRYLPEIGRYKYSTVKLPCWTALHVLQPGTPGVGGVAINRIWNGEIDVGRSRNDL